MTPGSILIFLVLFLDAIGGLLCVRARQYWHAIGLGSIVVPLCLGGAALGFSRAAAPTWRYDVETTEVLVVSFGALLFGVLAVVWLLWVGVRETRVRNQGRANRYG